MDLALVHPPHLIALACIYIASVLRDKDTTAWFEELRVDMNVVSLPIEHEMFLHPFSMVMYKRRTGPFLLLEIVHSPEGG
jgi:hypothetical protein